MRGCKICSRERHKILLNGETHSPVLQRNLPDLSQDQTRKMKGEGEGGEERKDYLEGRFNAENWQRIPWIGGKSPPQTALLRRHLNSSPATYHPVPPPASRLSKDSGRSKRVIFKLVSPISTHAFQDQNQALLAYNS